MKRGFTLLLIIVTILGLWWLYQKSATDQRAVSTAAPNVISYQAEQSTRTDPKRPSAKDHEAKVDELTTAVTLTNHLADEIKAESELTYLEVYRMNRQFETCQNIIYRLIEEDDFDPVASFENRINHLGDLYPDWPTTSQIEAVQQHANLCNSIYLQVQNIDLPELVKKDDIKLDSTYEMKQRLEQYLLIFQPKTPKEQAIADVLSLIEIWREHFNRVLEVSKGSENANQTEVEAIREQIEILSERRRTLAAEAENNLSSNQRLEMIDTGLEIERLNSQLIALKVVNPEERKQAITAFEVVNQMLFAELKSRDPDVFFEAQRALELNQNSVRNFGFSPYKSPIQNQLKEPFVEFVSPGEVIKNIVGINDNEIFSLVINHATQLYHCELGADCSPKGVWNPIYCHLGYNYLSPEACDYDLPVFLKEHYLNQNQWQDIQYILEILRSLYAS